MVNAVKVHVSPHAMALVHVNRYLLYQKITCDPFLRPILGNRVLGLPREEGSNIMRPTGSCLKSWLLVTDECWKCPPPAQRVGMTAMGEIRIGQLCGAALQLEKIVTCSPIPPQITKKSSFLFWKWLLKSWAGYVGVSLARRQ